MRYWASGWWYSATVVPWVKAEALAVPTFDAADSIFDFSRPSAEPLVASDSVAALAACRPQPESGWATRNPERAMLFLFVTPRDGALVEELLAA